MPSYGAVLKELVDAYVDECSMAENMSKDSFEDARPDLKKVGKVLEKLPIQFRRELIWFFNELNQIVENNSCHHPIDQLDGDEKTKQQVCKVCGMIRYYWVRDISDPFDYDKKTEEYWSHWTKAMRK